jgi:hypothetical protein
MPLVVYHEWGYGPVKKIDIDVQLALIGTLITIVIFKTLNLKIYSKLFQNGGLSSTSSHGQNCNKNRSAARAQFSMNTSNSRGNLTK